MPGQKGLILGIGVSSADHIPGMRRAAATLGPGTTVRIYGPETLQDDGVPDLILVPDPAAALIGDLVHRTIDGAVRGTLAASHTLRLLRDAVGADHLERVALLETAGGRLFFLAPVGVDEGWTVKEKVALIRRGRELVRFFGLPDRVGVLSGGRLGDLGRHPAVDRSMADAELAARLGEGVHCEILIEDAVGECGLVIAPDGIAGNLIFRTLAYLGGGKGHGAPVTNIEPVFVDTSRASDDYSYALRLAIALVRERKERYPGSN
ncbi:MAG TPA: methanogenesis marker protein Mmp4/MtxX [Methanoregulaceae archaeon]|nr:methanogenesis marker protein Mmp4/MtxX [Methanoregulaceae archaeon]HQJ87057.1 methanogenesis marker protein Mmp4/MtxX [Methanoregulaceae archaeon]